MSRPLTIAEVAEPSLGDAHKVPERKNMFSLKKEGSVLNAAAMIDNERVSVHKAKDDKRTLRNGIRACMANKCSQACQMLRPHGGQAYVVVSNTLVQVSSLAVIV